jgi:superfamily II DNA helicase RecQ
LRRNALKAVVATSALGMGYDKPDLAFCIHVGSPASPVAYYQQVGRAGRALDEAVVTLLPGRGDERLWEWFATASSLGRKAFSRASKHSSMSIHGSGKNTNSPQAKQQAST